MDRWFALLLLPIASLALGSDAPPLAHRIAQANDNRRAAGELQRGVLTLQLEMVETTWYPEQEGGPSLSVYSFAEKGKSPQIPGPLIRIPQGTEVHAQIHNALPVAMFIRGLQAHDASSPEPVLIAAGSTADFHFTAQTAGTYYYSARRRLINTSLSDHAMHLHGFYFKVNSVGEQDRDHHYSADQVPHVVTQHLDPGETASIVWTPDRP